eukprot:Nitzschia sp. Nitz4//scaffold63_size106090//35806//38067//NITZ4_004385-RA/size106090-processed-gene-0.54-mRNA-1//1//CDS//3329555960//5708//frame0
MVQKDQARLEVEAPLVGYTDKLSVRPGESLKVYVSSSVTPDAREESSSSNVTATLTRSICADPNPQGPGIIENDASQWFPTRTFAARHQPICSGSFARTESVLKGTTQNHESLVVEIWFQATAFQGTSCVWSWGEETHDISGKKNPSSLGLYLNPKGELQLQLGPSILVTTCGGVILSRWYHCSVVLGARPEKPCSMEVKNHTGEVVFNEESPAGALSSLPNGFFGLASGGTFNGKLEHPMIFYRDGEQASVLATWDTSQNMTGFTIPPTETPSAGNGPPSLVLFNHPTRAIKGHNWDATEQSWQHAPEQYGAIHFHDDDCYDFQWESDFQWDVPKDTPSGVYLLHLTVPCAEGGVYKESLPIFVRPHKDSPRTNRLCLLISTFTYVMYGNHARSDFDNEAWCQRVQDWQAYPHCPIHFPRYGWSTYNVHTDDSGIHFASHRRPLFNVRPGYLSLAHVSCSGLRHFPADSHLVAFLHQNDIDYDVVTDHDLHREGVSAIAGYSTLCTGSHPEYHSLNTLNALQEFRDVHGGNLVYLGGNGFYWRVAASNEDPDANLLEIRRCEGGVRTWAAEPGEYYHALDGSYGGLWRRNSRPPQQLVGVGFTAQGTFVGMPYTRVCFDPKMEWVFAGVQEEDWKCLGNFGLSGGGAAGFELDRSDRRLDGDDHELHILAQAFGNASDFMFVPEEVLTTYSNLSGQTESEARRSDMVYFQTKSGAKVFSVGSITFCGCLPHNNFDNPIATIVRNVLGNFLQA